MFLQALTAFYDRLAADPESGVASYGYSRQQVAFVVVVNADGTLHEVQSARVTDEKGKPRNRLVEVCGNAKPSGSGINPCFLWDNVAYTLGYKPDDPKPARTQESFDAFRDRHVALEAEIDDSGFAAVCAFLRSWDPAHAESQPVLKDASTGFGVFRIRGETRYVHESEPVRRWWDQRRQAAADSDAVVGRCFVTGEVGPLARLHEPKIKGVFGGQSSGAALVSFNLDAFNSYGKQQSFNAPVTELAAFKYCTALNWLLDPARNRRLSIGDTSVVFWTAQPTPMESVFPGFIAGGTPAEDEAKTLKLRDLIDQLARGELPANLGDPGTDFYVLGLSPNAARISVRFWLQSTLGEMLKNLGRHYADLEIARGPKDQPHPPLWRLLRETVRDAKEIPDVLEGALTRSVLSGSDYPQMFLSALLRRVRADREMRHVRAAAIKAYLNRNHQRGLPMSLDPERPKRLTNWAGSSRSWRRPNKTRCPASTTQSKTGTSAPLHRRPAASSPG